MSDNSPHRLDPPSGPEMLRHFLNVASTALQQSSPASTKQQDASAWKSWSCFSELMGVQPLRPKVADSDEVGLQREEWLQTMFILYHYRQMKPRRGNQHPKPESAMNALLGVRRYMIRQGVKMPPCPTAGRVITGLKHMYIKEHGQESLTPQRKQPFTRQQIEQMLDLPPGTTLGSKVVDGGHFWLVWNAFVSVKASTGFRTAEIALPDAETFWDISRASRANFTWCIGGKLYTSLTVEQLRNLKKGDYLLIRPPCSKADPFGEVWSAKPICLMYEETPMNAAWRVAQMELDFPIYDLQERKNTPMFCVERNAAKPLRKSHMVMLLPIVLKKVLKLSDAEAKCYSWHSFRIYLACALMASGQEPDTIKALLRWQSDVSLRIYARLNMGRYANMIQGALVADIDSVQTTNIEYLSTDGEFYQDSDKLTPRLMKVAEHDSE